MNYFNLPIKALLIFTIPLFLITACGEEESEIPPKIEVPIFFPSAQDTLSPATAIKNDRDFSATIKAFPSSESEEYFLIDLFTYDQNGIERENISIYFIPYQVGTYEVRRLPNTFDQLGGAVASWYYTKILGNNGLIIDDGYELDLESNQNQLTIESIDTTTNEVEGRFYLDFIKSDAFESNPIHPAEVIFSEGAFKTIIQPQ